MHTRKPLEFSSDQRKSINVNVCDQLKDVWLKHCQIDNLEELSGKTRVHEI